mmetsp:Transcript_8462/g.16470  ORF Transcript_8462/g.16470 Transcript_8462/m.16470 type:complete len:117 (-) Transcript_8462:96-446(-)
MEGDLPVEPLRFSILSTLALPPLPEGSLRLDSPPSFTSTDGAAAHAAAWAAGDGAVRLSDGGAEPLSVPGRIQSWLPRAGLLEGCATRSFLGLSFRDKEGRRTEWGGLCSLSRLET